MFYIFRQIPFGLDISDFSIEALQLKKSFGRVYLKTYARIVLEKGIVEDGKIINQEKFKEKVKELLANARPKIKTKRVIISLPESKTFFKIFKFSNDFKGEELKEAVKKKAFRTIPLNPQDIYFDFKVISETDSEKEVFYVAVSKEIVDNYLEIFKDIGLEITVLDIEAGSLARAFENEMIKEGAVLIVDIGARTTILTIFDKNFIRQSIVLSIGGNYFTETIAKKLGISFEKAEELKKIYGLDLEKGERKIVFILQNLFKEIFDRVKQLISFYEKRSGQKVKKVLLCGGSSLMPKLISNFSLNLGIESKLANPFLGIEKSMPKEKIHPIFFSNVVGLAKRAFFENPQEQGINLIPLEKRIKTVFIGKKLNENKIFRFSIIFSTSLVIVFFLWAIYNFILKGLLFFILFFR